jgi:hypothetical protein
MCDLFGLANESIENVFALANEQIENLFALANEQIENLSGNACRINLSWVAWVSASAQ